MMFNEKSLIKSNFNWVKPWLGYRLDSKIINYLWEIVKEGKEKNESAKGTLAGNLSHSFYIVDKDNIFEENLYPLVQYYCKNYNYFIPDPPIVVDKNFNKLKCLLSSVTLESFWANYQYKHEFNPIHKHTGFLSFVIWLKIPYDNEDQEKLSFLEGVQKQNRRAGNFQFTFTDMNGQITQEPIIMNKNDEGVMLIFPSSLHHQVFPFYNTDTERVSISGNIAPLYQFDKGI